jgi:hypothetical protein
MRHTLLAAILSAIIVAGATAEPAAAQPTPQIAYYTAYVKAWYSGATYYDATNCSATTCTGMYDAVAWMNNRDTYVRDVYTIRLGRDGSATALGNDHWSIITKQQIVDDMLGRGLKRVR